MKVKGWCPRTRRVEGGGEGLELKELKREGKDLDRVFEREKRGASVHRRKCERCHRSCTGLEEERLGGGALGQRTNVGWGKCGGVKGALRQGTAHHLTYS